MTNVVIGVTGGIAAYKACDLVSPLRDAGHSVRAAMTRAATRFLQPLTLAALTGHAVLVDDLAEADPTIPHIAWARWADLVVVAPATADALARIANGHADEALFALLLALEPEKRVLIAPAMNTQMWTNSLVQQNVERLRSIDSGRRFAFVEPVDKRLACGEIGIGALAAPDAIVRQISALLAR